MFIRPSSLIVVPTMGVLEYKFSLILKNILKRNSFIISRSLSAATKPSPNCSSNSALTLYVDDTSPPARFVLMTVKHLCVDLNIKKVDLFKKENKTDSFTVINPLQKVPAITIGDATIVDSNAISMYLCQKYDARELYPDSAKLKAHIHHLMFFNATTLFHIDNAVYTDFFTAKLTDDNKVAAWISAMDYLEHILKNHPWLSGDCMTLSDLCCVATISSFQVLVPPSGQHPRIAAWMSRMKAQQCYEPNEHGLKRLRKIIRGVSRLTNETNWQNN